MTNAKAQTAQTAITEDKAPTFAPVVFGRKMAANRLFADNRVIRLNPEIADKETGAVKINPKRGKAATRFALYKDKMTVGEYIAACVEKGDKPGVATADLKFDTERNFIVIE